MNGVLLYSTSTGEISDVSKYIMRSSILINESLDTGKENAANSYVACIQYWYSIVSGEISDVSQKIQSVNVCYITSTKIMHFSPFGQTVRRDSAKIHFCYLTVI